MELSWAVKFFLDATRRRDISRRDGYRAEAALGAIGHLPPGPVGRLAIVGDRMNVLARAARSLLADSAIESVEFPTDDAPPFVSPARPEDPPLGDRSVDAVLVASLSHALDRRAAIGEAMRLVRPGGSIVVLGDATVANWLRDRCTVERSVQLAQGQTVTIARRVERDRVMLPSAPAAATAPAPVGIDVDAVRSGRVSPLIRRLICLVEQFPGRSVLVAGDVGSAPFIPSRSVRRSRDPRGRARDGRSSRRQPSAGSARGGVRPPARYGRYGGGRGHDRCDRRGRSKRRPVHGRIASGARRVAPSRARLIVAMALPPDVTGTERFRLDSGLPMSRVLSWFDEMALGPEVEVIAARSIGGEGIGRSWLVAWGPAAQGPTSPKAVTGLVGP